MVNQWQKIYGYLFFLSSCYVASCNQPQKPENLSQQKRSAYIRAIAGKNDTIAAALVQQGEVLVAYSDCYSCHKEDKKVIGPAFRDIAERYPVQPAYVQMLAQRIITGGSGSWGQAIMSPHPKVSQAEAEIMVSYILSLKAE
ncbi:MAG: cytochrome [Adhaeribacter sp.]|jgi:cytochrome c|nr:cytochrome [Adhaeribacter sp.]